MIVHCADVVISILVLLAVSQTVRYLLVPDILGIRVHVLWIGSYEELVKVGQTVAGLSVSIEADAEGADMIKNG